MALTADANVILEQGSYADFQVKASSKIYAGGFVGDDAAGAARALVAGDPFYGVAESVADNSAGAVGAVRVRTLLEGKIVMAVTGVTGIGDIGASVYASADDTLTLTLTSNSLMGKVVDVVSGTTCVVSFKSDVLA